MCTLGYNARFTPVVLLAAAIAGCSTHPAPSSNWGTSAPSTEAQAPQTPQALGADAGTLHASTAAPSDAPDASASPPASGDGGARDASAAETSAPAPRKGMAGGPIRVINIGMHIGGGPNDDVTKEPIHKSVAPHFEAFGQCFPAGAAPPVDFGVDLVIEAKGGKAQVARPRTALRDDAFVACVVGVFEGIDFLPPRFGKTVVSYSLRFVPAAPKH